MSVIKIKAGEHTEELIQYILKQVDDADLDTIEVERKHAPVDGLASEPITTAIVLTLGTTLIISIARSIEKYIEKKRQEENLRITLEAFEVSPEAGKALAELSKTHAGVSVAYGIPQAKG